MHICRHSFTSVNIPTFFALGFQVFNTLSTLWTLWVRRNGNGIAYNGVVNDRFWQLLMQAFPENHFLMNTTYLHRKRSDEKPPWGYFCVFVLVIQFLVKVLFAEEIFKRKENWIRVMHVRDRHNLSDVLSANAHVLAMNVGENILRQCLHRRHVSGFWTFLEHIKRVGEVSPAGISVKLRECYTYVGPLLKTSLSDYTVQVSFLFPSFKKVF